MAGWKIKIICLPAMPTPLLAMTADGALESENYWLACDVRALIGRDCHLACHLNYKLFARRQCLRPRWP
jgi:hypothetical protein